MKKYVEEIMEFLYIIIDNAVLPSKWTRPIQAPQPASE